MIRDFPNADKKQNSRLLVSSKKTMTKLIYPFSSKKIPTLSEVGGKGLSLILTAQEGLPVPDGFVLTMEFFKEWLQAVERSGEWRSASNASTENRKQHFDEVKEKALGFSFSDVQKNELAKAMKIFGEHLMAVRSSSPEEDLEGSSFAGGYETVLGVTEKTLEKSIKTAFVSCLDERIFVYKKEQGFSTEKPSIAVIIQQQIASDVSGVAFSLNPQNNCYDEAVINSNFGLGETIVAGQVTPDTFIVDMPKKEILEKKIANKSHALWLKKNGGTEKKDNENPEKPSLTDKQAKEVAQLAGDAEKFFEKPMDIEWAFENKKLYLLQARPITTYLPLFPEMITKPGERKNIYMDIIVLTQGFSEPFSVLGLDIWAKMLEIAKGPTMIRGLDGIVFDIHGRQYLHMSNMMKAGGGLVKKMMTAYDVPTRKIFEAIDTKEYTPEETPEKLKGYLWGFIKYMGKMFPAMLSGWLHPDRAFEAYFKESDRMWKYLKKDLPKENKTFDTLVKNGLSVFGSIVEAAGGMITIIIGPLVLKRIFKNEEEATDLLVALNMDLPGNPTSEMGHLMLKIASFTEFQNTTNAEEFINNLKSKKYSKEFLKTYKEYIDRFGCRGMKEIDIATPRPYENLETIFNQLKQININDNAIKNVKKRKEESYAK
ncbi:hypothetical protein KAR91_35825, partial [Candidatus Pacearchaeota archaeon]|nr:hypothetical protein [Candidatus Pacearchaeota archaeon]